MNSSKKDSYSSKRKAPKIECNSDTDSNDGTPLVQEKKQRQVDTNFEGNEKATSFPHFHDQARSHEEVPQTDVDIVTQFIQHTIQKNLLDQVSESQYNPQLQPNPCAVPPNLETHSVDPCTQNIIPNIMQVGPGHPASATVPKKVLRIRPFTTGHSSHSSVDTSAGGAQPGSHAREQNHSPLQVPHFHAMTVPALTLKVNGGLWVMWSGPSPDQCQKMESSPSTSDASQSIICNPIHSLIKDGIRYIWYMNPETKRMNLQVTRLEDNQSSSAQNNATNSP